MGVLKNISNLMKNSLTIILIVSIFTLGGCNKQIKEDKAIDIKEFESFYEGFAVIERDKPYVNGTIVIKTEENWNEFVREYLDRSVIDFAKKHTEINFDNNVIIYTGTHGGSNEYYSKINSLLGYKINNKIIEPVQNNKENGYYAFEMIEDKEIYMSVIIHQLRLVLVDKDKIPNDIENSYQNMKGNLNILL